MRHVTAAVGLVALAVVAVGWLQNPDHVTAAEARAAAESAYVAAGLRGAVVDPGPVAGVYVAAEGRERIDVWRTSATLDGGTVELWLSRVDGESVFLDDRSPDGSSQLLTDEQFRQLADHYENPAVGRQIRRNLVLTLAAALVGLLALRLSLVARRRPVSAVPARRSALRRLSPFPRRRPAVAVPVGRSGLRRVWPFARRRSAAAVPVPRPAFRAPPRPGRPLRARQEIS